MIEILDFRTDRPRLRDPSPVYLGSVTHQRAVIRKHRLGNAMRASSTVLDLENRAHADFEGIFIVGQICRSLMSTAFP
jgi:hypothetical protein